MPAIVGFVGYFWSRVVREYRDLKGAVAPNPALAVLPAVELESWRIIEVATIKRHPAKKQEPDHFVAGVIVGSQLLRNGYRFIIGAPCGHKHRDEADAQVCLEKLKKGRRAIAAAYQRHGKIFAVDQFGISLPMKWTAEELAQINK